jgi:SAM-dependent methyltransferase
MTDDLQRANDETREAWNANAQVWDRTMGDEGNDFFRILQWPAITRLLAVQPGWRVIDIACGNGLTSRKLAALGARVTAFDFSAEMIQIARGRSTMDIDYSVVDATDEAALISLSSAPFDAALCNMALFDIADIAPLFRALSRLLGPGRPFVFSLTHPAFNNVSTVHVAELADDEGVVKTAYAVKVYRYMTPYHARGVALRDQPCPQFYFERPLQYYLNLGFENGFVLDGFEECAFPPDHPAKNPLGWAGQFSEIPPVLVARLRRVGDRGAVEMRPA